MHAAPQRDGLHFGFSSLGCPDSGLDDLLGQARRSRLAAVEIRALTGSLDLAGYFARHFETPERLAAHLRSWTDVAVPVVDSSLRLIGNDPAARKAFLELVPWAEACGAFWIRVFDGAAKDTASGFAEAAATLEWWEREKQQRGWRIGLAVETHDTLLTSKLIADFLSSVPPVGVLWDAHHTWRRGGEPVETTWSEIGHAVTHIHVKDSRAQPGANPPYQYVLPGDGEFPMGPLLACLRTSGFPGCVALEWERLWHPALPPLDLAIERAADWWAI